MAWDDRIHEVIDPADTRSVITRFLDVCGDRVGRIGSRAGRPSSR
jgi:hypothetical protein